MKTLQETFMENLESYRELVADIDGFSASEKDEAIKIIFNNINAVIEHSWGIHAAQLALHEKFKIASQKAFEYDSIASLANAEPVDLKIEGAILTSAQSNQKEDYTP